jgi:hypothetical protein
MSVLDRRLQLLIDADLWSRLEAEATRTHRSVAAVVREGIAMYFDATGSTRRAAAARVLALPPTPGREADWAETKRQVEADLGRGLP